MIQINGVPLTQIVAGHYIPTDLDREKARAAARKARILRGEISRALSDTEIHELVNIRLWEESRARGLVK